MLENNIYNSLFKDLERFLTICNCEKFMNRESYKMFTMMVEKLNDQIEMLEIIKERDRK